MRAKEKANKILLYAAVAMLAVFCLFGLHAYADESLVVGMDQYKTDNGKILIYVNHNKTGSFNPNMEESSVMVGKQSLPIEGIKKFGDVNEPVSYMFIVDISGSMDKDRIATIKETLHTFIDAKKSGDNFCVTTMGDDLVSSGFSEDAQVLGSFVDGIEVTRQDTDLYKSVKEELNVLKTDKSVHEKRCLVIFSDGADDQKDGITQSEAETQVKESHIPIFTIALLPKNYKDADLESAKILGSFARYSAGGQHYVPQIDEFECKEVCQKITSVIQNSLIVSADLAEVVAADGNIYVGVELSDGSSKGKDGIQIPVGDILDAIKEAQSVQVNININKDNGGNLPVETTTETETVPVEEESSNLMLILIIAAVIVAIIIIIIVVILSGKKKEEQPVSGNPGSMSQGGDSSRTIGIGQGVPAPAPKKDPNALRVTLYKIGPGQDEKYPIVLDGKKSIGRRNTCDLRFEADTALSGVHCYIFSKDKKIYVQDNTSTNGTFINGVPITGEYCVESGDIMLIGSAEYRIVQE